jgi:hypothetical protein
MDRRQFLALSSAGVLGSAAGCTGGDSPTDDAGSNATPTSEATASGPGSAASVGETVTTETGIAITATDAQLVNEAMTPDGKLIPSESGHRIALVRLEAENTADAPRNLPAPEEIAMVTGGTQYPAEVDFGGRRSDEYTQLTEPVSGEFYESIQDARPSVSASGWVLFDVPTNTSSGRLSWSRSEFVDGEEVALTAEWDLQFDPASLANIQVDRVDAPSTALHHYEVDVVLEVSNSGGTEGTFEGAIRSENLQDPVPVTATVPAGESTTVAVSVPYPNYLLIDTEDGPVETTYSIGDESFTVTFESPTLDAGEGVTYPSGLYLELREIRRIGSYVTEGPFGDPMTQRPDQGYQFLAFRFVVENRGEQTLGVVGAYNFSVLGDGEYDPSVALGRTDGTVSGEISGGVYPNPESIPANTSVSGWVVLEVTQGVGENPRIEYQNETSDYPMLAPEWQI